jgi:1,4-alpha-glucan branching enzyme
LAFPIRIHFDNSARFQAPHLWGWHDGSALVHELAPAGYDAFGPFFDVAAARNFLRFKFKDGAGTPGVRWEDPSLNRSVWPLLAGGGQADEVWCKGDRAFVYHQRPRAPENAIANDIVRQLAFAPEFYVPETGGLSGLGALPLAAGGVLFGLYHPNAGRVFVAGDFNDWQSPDAPSPDPTRFIELNLYRGWFGEANTWLKIVPIARSGDEYKFYAEGGVPRGGNGRPRRWIVDPYARRLGPDFNLNNSVVDHPAGFAWTDANWRTPDVGELIFYELSVYGFTEGDPEIAPDNRGRFAGVTERIRAGYFERHGVSALSLMPLAEFPSQQSPTTLGYNPSLFHTVERDFGTPDDLRALVDAAHAQGMAVLLDQVFNHTDNTFNPLWQAILEHPDEEDRGDGGLYFNGSTPWGNRVATEKADVQNLLIDACKMWIREYHVDGFRFDATHEWYMDHGFLLRLAEELKGFKPDVLLVAENLPNQRDLNRRGHDGFAQWCDPFHDKIKALLREGPFEAQLNGPDGIGDIFYFSKSAFAAHTNNTVNYCESHDEHSVAHELRFVPWPSDAAPKDRKAKLGVLASVVALGQPTIYMGQEFNTDRPRNIVTVDWPHDLNANGFFQWISRLLNLRKRYPGLRLRGDDPARDGSFAWILGPWMNETHGGGRRIVGWRARPSRFAHDDLAVLLSFESSEHRVDLDLGTPGRWIKLADIDSVNDIPPAGTNSAATPTTLESRDGRFVGFAIPSFSGFIYKWDAPI